MTVIIPIFIPHRGCPHRCVFCDQINISGTEQPLKPEELRDEVLRWHSYSRSDDFQLAFYGGSFTCLPGKLRRKYLEFGNKCIGEGLLSSLRCSTRPDGIDDEILKECTAYGMTVLELGVQSMDDRVLAASKRGHTSSRVKTATTLIRKYPLKLGIQQMVGLPKASLKSDLNSADDIIRLHPDFVRIYPTVVPENTELYQMYSAGIYRPLSLEEAVDMSAEIYKKYRRAGIPVIRIGLQADKSLDTSKNLKGPYHPSLGQMVKTKVLTDDFINHFKNIPKGGNYEIFCPESVLPNLVGQKGTGRKKVEKFLRGRVKFYPIQGDGDISVQVIDGKE